MPARVARQRLARAFAAAAWALRLEVEATQEELREEHDLDLAAALCQARALDEALLETSAVTRLLAAHTLLSRDVPGFDGVVARRRARLAADSELVASIRTSPLRAWLVWPPEQDPMAAGRAVPLGLEAVLEASPIETVTLLGGRELDTEPAPPHVVVGWRVELGRFCALLGLAWLDEHGRARIVEAVDEAQQALGRVADGFPERLIWEAVGDELLLALSTQRT